VWPGIQHLIAINASQPRLDGIWRNSMPIECSICLKNNKTQSIEEVVKTSNAFQSYFNGIEKHSVLFEQDLIEFEEHTNTI
jgi:hypothetical protein